MKNLKFVCLGLMSCGLLFTSYTKNVENENARDTRIIVSLVDVNGEDEQSRELVRESFKNQLFDKIGFNYRIVERIEGLSNILILDINKNDLETIQNMKIVENASIENVYETCSYTPTSFNPNITNQAPDNNYSRLEMNAYSGSKEGEGVLIAVLDNSFELTHEALQPLTCKTLYDKSYIENVVAEGQLQVASQYKDADKLYKNSKVVFAYDYANEDDTMFGPNANHGIHVSSIAAANGSYTGIAPNAQLALMKVFGDNSGGASSTDIIQALNDCYALGVDVVNMSLGSPNQDSKNLENSTEYKVIDKLNKKGCIVCVSAGNEGKGRFIKNDVQTNNYGDYDSNALDDVEPGILGSFANLSNPLVVASTCLDNDTEMSKGGGAYASKVSGFSSDGPTYYLGLNPDVAAPGTNIWGATWTGGGDEDKDGNKLDYVYMDGTSMAAPNYSGAVANVLSNLEFSTIEEKKEVIMTVQMRTMSTATKKVQTNKAFFTPRKQGSGIPNIEAASKTKVYLENFTNKAKVELKNNDDIKVGHIKFDVTTHNLDSVAKSYNGKLYIQAQGLTKEDKCGSLADSLLETVDLGNITVNPGDSSFSVDYTINSESKAYMDKFPVGNYLEGFVVLTANDDSDYDLSIPYMGFYGDYYNAPAVEPFDFERDNSYVYGSDLINSLFKTFLSKNNSDFTSKMVVSATSIAKTKVFDCSTNLYTLGNQVTRDGDSLLLGINGLSNYLTIQQIIYRSCSDNRVTLISDATGETVYSNKLELLSTDGDSYTDGSLTKSKVDYNDSSNLYTYKAYLEIPIIGNDGALLFDEGNYTLKFEYDLVAGTTVTKTYNVIVREGEAEQAYSTSRETINYNNKDYLRCYFNQDSIVSAAANGDELEIKHDDTNTYVDIEISKYSSKGKVLLEFVNDLALESKELIDLTNLEETMISVDNKNMLSTYTIYSTITEGEVTDGYFTNNYVISVKNASKKAVSINNSKILLKIPKTALNDANFITVVDKQGSKDVEIEFKLERGCLTFDTLYCKFDITFKYSEPVDPTEEEPTIEPTPSPVGGGCTKNSNVVSSEIIISNSFVVGLLALVLVLLRKKNK